MTKSRSIQLVVLVSVLLGLGQVCAANADSADRRPITLAGRACVAEGFEVLPESLTGLALATDQSSPLDARFTTRTLVFNGQEFGGTEVFTVELLADGARPVRTIVRHAWSDLSSGTFRLRRLLVADESCRPRIARALRYESAAAPAFIDVMSFDFAERRRSLPLNPELPQGSNQAKLSAVKPVPVGLIDTGVNYLLAPLAARLARDSDDELVGFDYWDMDDRPFDSDVSRSPFQVRRHGTQIAALLLDEAPVATIAPYRYPRSDFRRMRALIEDAAAHGLRIMNVSVGSAQRSQWQDFAAAAREHPDILFVVAAGDRDKDLDAGTYFPASLALENQLSVASAEADGGRARGSNFGVLNVDVAVPGQRRLSADFSGQPIIVSGTNYAAARVSALAACLLALHPEWRAAQLKQALLALARPFNSTEEAYTRAGVIPEPTYQRRGLCLPTAAPPTVTASARWRFDSIAGPNPPAAQSAQPEKNGRTTPKVLDLQVAILQGNRWHEPRIFAALKRAVALLAQCGIQIRTVAVNWLAVEPRYQYLRDDVAADFFAQADLDRPVLIFHRDSRQRKPFDAAAYGLSNTIERPWLRDSLWFGETLRHEGIAIAHELVHLLADNGTHTQAPGNLMRAESSPDNVALSAGQCQAAVERGLQRGLLSESGSNSTGVDERERLERR